MKHTQKTRLTIIGITLFTLITLLSAIVLIGLSFIVFAFWRVEPVLLFGSATVLAVAIGAATSYRIVKTYKKAKENNKIIRIIAELIEAILFAW